MGYKKLVIMEIREVIRRYFDNQSISRISEVTGYGRKTIRCYIKHVTGKGRSHHSLRKSK